MRTVLTIAGLAMIGLLLIPRCAKEPTSLPAEEWIDLLSPAQGTTWTVGDTVRVTWTSRGTSGQVKVELNRGGSWATLGTVSASVGLYDWVVTGPEATGCRVRVSDVADGSPSVESGTLAISEFHSLLDMVPLPGGTFEMGSTSSWAQADEDTHTVTVSAFSMAKYEVTQAEYEEVMGSNPSYFSGDNRPVEQVTWWNAAKFCNALSAREGLTKFYNDDDLNSQASTVRMTWSADGYRLPTEAEWEYACRAGTTTDLYSGDLTSGGQDPNMDAIGWYYYNSDQGSGRQTHDVGGKQPNSFGLYDMSGNVWEWCNDWYGDYSSGAQTDPTGPSTGSIRVDRGGSWYRIAEFCRSAYRYYYGPSISFNGLGFRPARR